MTPEAALAWAQARKKGNETVMIVSCPCCRELLAIYIAQEARQELVPYTNLPSHQAEPSIDSM